MTKWTDKQIKEYWGLARESKDVIATWPQWKQDYHRYKKKIRAGLMKIKRDKEDGDE